MKLNRAIVLFCIVVSAFCEDEKFPSMDEVRLKADRLDGYVGAKFISNTKLLSVEKIFRDDEDPMSVVEKDDFKLVKEMSKRIGELFQKKFTALKRLVREAEKLVRNTPYDPEIRADELEEYTSVHSTSKNDSACSHCISDTKSGIHIPVEIWQQDETILNAVNWTFGLESTFLQNKRQDPNIRWQYFASESGMLRIFPAPMWPIHNEVEVDLFDVRRRPWYIQATVDPKDIIVLMDVSGSMHGKALDIMKVAVKSFLNSLNEHDYINVAWYTDNVGWVSCLEGLVQANNVNKKLLFEGIERVREENSSSYEVALEFGFRELQKFYDEKVNGNRSIWEGADCHKMIVLFSDGGTDLPIHVLNKYKQIEATSDIRVFTYAVGPHPIPIVTLENMACNTSGGFDVFITLSQARYSMRELVEVLNRPLVLSAEEQVGDERLSTLQNISSPYHNFLGDQEMVVTLSAPVVNITEQNETVLVGVMGIDVGIEELVALTPWGKLPPSSYPFVINSNGHVLYHPYLKRQNGFNMEAPDVDISELEGNKLQMRNQLVQGQDVEVIEKSAYFTSDFKYIGFQKYDISACPVPDLPFRIALVTPKNEEEVQLRSTTYPLVMKDYMTNSGFCSELFAQFPVNTVVELEQLRKHGSCDEEMIKRMLWDSKKIDEVKPLWTKHKNGNTRFLLTSGGFGITVPASEMALIQDETDPRKSKYFTRSASTDSLVITKVQSENETLIMQMKRIQVTANGNTATVAVAGFFQSIGDFFRMVSDLYPECRNNSFYTCYLVDEGAYVMYSSKEYGDVGSLIGEVDPWLFERLLNESVYEQFRWVDHRALCPIPTQVSAASHIQSLLKYFLHTPWQTLALWISSLLAWWSPVDALSELNLERRDGMFPCAQEQYFFSLPDSFRETQGHISCQGCQRRFSLAKLLKTNLILVVAENDCSCDSIPYLPPHRPTQIPKEEEEAMVCSTSPLPRLRSQRCFRFHSEEEPKPKCVSSGSSIALSTGLLLLVAFNF